MSSTQLISSKAGREQRQFQILQLIDQIMKRVMHLKLSEPEIRRIHKSLTGVIHLCGMLDWEAKSDLGRLLALPSRPGDILAAGNLNPEKVEG